MNWIAILFPYRTHLEYQLKQQREDFDKALADKNLQIRNLRNELAGVRTALITNAPPDDTRIRDVVMKFDGPQDWQGELNKMLQEEEGVDHGI